MTAAAAVAVSGSMVPRRSSVVPPFVVHVKPVGVPHPDHGARHVAALVLIIELGRQQCINPVKGGPKLDQSGGGKLDHPAARWRV